jgi:glycosyltransferase involved in cell wall biosynthesis
MSIVRTIYSAFVPYSIRVPIARLRYRAASTIRKARFILGLKGKRQRPYEGKQVAVVGMFSTRSGLGRAAELIAQSIEKKGSLVTRVNIPLRGLESIGNTATNAAECEKKGSSIADLIVVANPPVFFQALSMFSLEWLRQRTIVAHWVWELDVVDRDWNDAVKICDEVWASSEFVAQTLKPLCEARSVLLKVVPYPVDIDPFQPAGIEQKLTTRRKFRISEDAFVVGYSFAVSSNLPRKNPMGAVAAFQRAFNKDKDVILIIRALDGHIYRKGMMELKRAVAEDPRIIVVEHSSDLPIADFYAVIDLYVSPARSEGYGLNIVEATQAGHPVVAVEWSLSRDVLGRPGVVPAGYTLVPVAEDQGDYARVKGARWANPDIDDMARKIVAIRDASTSD